MNKKSTTKLLQVFLKKKKIINKFTHLSLHSPTFDIKSIKKHIKRIGREERKTEGKT